MSRRFSLTAEIIRRPDDCLPKMALPDTVHHDAAHQRLVRGRQPQGESFAALRNKEHSLWLLDRWTRVKSRGKAGLDFFAFCLEIALDENVCVRNHLLMQQDVSGRKSFGRPQIG